MWIGLTIVFALTCAVCIISLFGIKRKIEKQIKDLKEDKEKWLGKYEEGIERIKLLENRNEISRNSFYQLKEKYDALKALDDNSDGQVTAKTEELKRLEEQLMGLYRQRDELESRNIEVSRAVQDKSDEINKRTEQINELDSQIRELESRNVKVQGELKNLLEKLDLAQQTNRALLVFNSGDMVKWEFKLNGKEQRLIELFDELCDLYPELTIEFRTIEWRKIWLSKMQDLCKREGLEVNGIYRLELKSNADICYVGQAINIKERWYQHCKKMIGADSRGNEKVYDYRPEDFYWMVLERDIQGNDNIVKNALNEKEKYWIEFYKSNEGGLNTK